MRRVDWHKFRERCDDCVRLAQRLVVSLDRDARASTFFFLSRARIHYTYDTRLRSARSSDNVKNDGDFGRREETLSLGRAPSPRSRRGTGMGTNERVKRRALSHAATRTRGRERERERERGASGDTATTDNDDNDDDDDNGEICTRKLCSLTDS